MQRNLKGRFLAAIGHVPAAHESAADAFDQLRATTPDAFPVPRGSESFWDAISEVVARHEEGSTP
jgi:hypothetical protein